MRLGKRYVAYRANSNDFHFMLRHENGNWSHKPGGKSPQAISQKIVFSEEWPGYYNFPVLYFEL